MNLDLFDVFGGKSAPDIVHSYCFRVYVYQGESWCAEIGFSKISGINEKAEYETIVEGNGRVHLVPKYTTQVKTITFSKGMASHTYDTVNILSLGNTFTNIVLKVGDARFDDFGIDCRTYVFKDCVLVGYSISDLNANDSSITIENFEVSYVECMELS